MKYTEQQKAENRKALITCIFDEMKPERTGRVSFDGASWNGTTLELTGQHMTPDLKVEFLKGGRMWLTMTRNREIRTAATQWFDRPWVTAQNIVTTFMALYVSSGWLAADDVAFRAYDR